MNINGTEFYPLASDVNYLISSDGQVYTLYKKRISKQHDNNGYKMVWLKSKWGYVHRLVAQQFIPNPDGKKWVNHKDGNKANNSVDNLEWTTISENIQHAWNTGLHERKKGAEHWNAGRKATAQQRQAMSDSKRGERHPKFKGYYNTPWGTFTSALQAEKETGVGQRTIKGRCNNKRFMHLGYSFTPVNIE